MEFTEGLPGQGNHWVRKLFQRERIPPVVCSVCDREVIQDWQGLWWHRDNTPLCEPAGIRSRDVAVSSEDA
jgi:hypothetical protein